MNKISITGYKIYTFQHKLADTMADKWVFSNWDCFGSHICPVNNDGVPKYPETEEVRNVWQVTHHQGFWTLKYAEKALARLKTANKQGKHLKVFGTRELDFRIVAVTVFPSIVEVMDKEMRTIPEICKEEGLTQLDLSPKKTNKK